MDGEGLHETRRVRVRRDPALDVGEKACELHQQDEGDQHADECEPLVVEDVVREARCPERRRDQGQQQHRMLLREPEPHEAVRAVVAPALRDRAALEQPHDRDERRVEDRHGQHENRQQERRHRRPGDLPARGEAQRRQREPEHLRAGIAHEDERLAPTTEVEGQEAGTCERPRERDREDGVARMDGDRVDREERERDRSEGRGEPIHVVEQVERVRHPDEPDQRERPGDHLVVDQLHVRPGGEHDDRRGELDGELADRRQRTQVVDQPCGEEERDPGVDPCDLAGGRDRTGGDGQPQPDGDPGEDPDPSEQRGRALVPAVGRGCRDQACCHRGAEQDPDGERSGGKSGDGREGAHVGRG